MSIKNLKIDNISSLQEFDFSFQVKNNIEKNIVVFGTNGSGKSTLVDTLQLLNKYSEKPDTGNKDELVNYLISKISKESQSQNINIEIDFDKFSNQIEFNPNTKNLSFNTDTWQKIKVFNDKYTLSTIGNNIDINLKENGLIIGEPNITLDKERRKQKSLTKTKKEILEKIESKVSKTKDEFIKVSDSSAVGYLKKISVENFLKDTCSFKEDKNVLKKRQQLGYKKQEQKSSSINIENIKSIFILDAWEKLFNTQFHKPELTDEYKILLDKYSEFYQYGMNIKEDSIESKCPYCLQEWKTKENSISEFTKYLSSEYNQSKEKVESLNKKLGDFISQIEEKNKELERQRKIVEDECKTYGIDYSQYKSVTIEQSKIDAIKSIVESKKESMNQYFSIKDKLEDLQLTYYNALKNSMNPIKKIEEEINSRTLKVRALNTKLSEHHMKSLWTSQKTLRTTYKTIEDKIEKCNESIQKLESKNEDINTIQEVFNGLLKFIGLEEYHLNVDNKLQLTIDTTYDITNEGVRISTAQRKILSLCYFYAEIISEIQNETELKQYILVYDDPLDSADYIFFHSITSLIENSEKILAKILKKDNISFSQHVVFTHNSLLFNRLTQNFNLYKRIQKINKITQVKSADKIEDNYKIYLEMIIDFIKKEEESSQREKIFIGNIIRRILEIIISFNELNTNNTAIIKDYGKPTLGLIANHLSHENFSKVLNPLPTDIEMKKACHDLLEIIEEHYPRQYKYIEKNLLNKVENR